MSYVTWRLAVLNKQVGYEALHRAGLNLESLRGSNTGVFVGACGTDWAARLAEGAGPARGTYTRFVSYPSSLFYLSFVIIYHRIFGIMIYIFLTNTHIYIYIVIVFCM